MRLPTLKEQSSHSCLALVTHEGHRTPRLSMELCTCHSSLPPGAGRLRGVRKGGGAAVPRRAAGWRGWQREVAAPPQSQSTKWPEASTLLSVFPALKAVGLYVLHAAAPETRLLSMPLGQSHASKQVGGRISLSSAPDLTTSPKPLYQRVILVQ